MWNYGKRNRRHYDTDLRGVFEKNILGPMTEYNTLNEIELDLVNRAIRIFPELEEKYGVLRSRKIIRLDV